jgi:LPS sulfotransferase NodH
LFSVVEHDATPEQLGEACREAMGDWQRTKAATAFALERLTAKTMAEQFENHILEITRPKLVNYMIAFTQRSGSSLLCDLLRKSGNMGRPYEAFETDKDGKIVPYARRYAGWNSETMADHYASHLKYNNTNGITGAKVTWDQWQGLIGGLGGEPHVDKWVWLRRRDILRQAISLYRAEQTSQWDLFKDDQPKPAPQFDGPAILETAKRLQGQETLWGAFFARHNIKPLVLWYEDLIRQPAKTVETMAKFLGVKVAEILPTDHRIQRDDVTEAWAAQLTDAWAALDTL